MAIGPKLREARQNKQLTTSQVAEMTRMKVQIVDDLENDDFHRIAATIYGKGFIKLYAECVDLDPEPLIEDYMEQAGSSQPPKLPKAKKREPAQPPPETQSVDSGIEDKNTQSGRGEEATADDLFSYAVQNREKKAKKVTASSAPPPNDSGADNENENQWQSALAIASRRAKDIWATAKRTFEDLLKHFSETGKYDVWIQRGLIVIGILIVILIMIPLGRMLFGGSDQETLPDDTLIQFAEPPHLYQD